MILDNSSQWPSLPLVQWHDTCETLHLWSQIVGKIRLKYTPWTNHSWHVPLYLTAQGLTTSLIPHKSTPFEINFDFVNHRLSVVTAQGGEGSFALRPMSVASFYNTIMQTFRDMGLDIEIWPVPVELPNPVIPFPDDEAHGSYDPEYAHRFWQALLSVNRVFTVFRSRFIGKVSPVHFFWGAFDLAVTRFSGRTAPLHPGGVPNCADWVMQEAYSHEVSSAGFWPGNGLGEPAFYSYAYPEPEGFRRWKQMPEEAYFHEELGEFILPYEAVRMSVDPEGLLLTFLQNTFDAAAELGNWDREDLERIR